MKTLTELQSKREFQNVMFMITEEKQLFLIT